jgi:hypothetical protein
MLFSERIPWVHTGAPLIAFRRKEFLFTGVQFSPQGEVQRILRRAFIVHSFSFAEIHFCNLILKLTPGS